MPPGPHASWAWRTHKVASPVTSHTHRSDGSPQESRAAIANPSAQTRMVFGGQFAALAVGIIP